MPSKILGAAIGVLAIAPVTFGKQHKHPAILHFEENHLDRPFFLQSAQESANKTLQEAFDYLAPALENPPLYSDTGAYAHLPQLKCFERGVLDSEQIDIAFVGAPFDTATTYRPGARFGPTGIRLGSRRLAKHSGHSVENDFNPFNGQNARVVDCGDIPVTPMDNRVALTQIQTAHQIIGSFAPANTTTTPTVPRIITLGGDHTITLPAMRAAYKHWGPLSILHFDSHVDTFRPRIHAPESRYSRVNHGTYFHIAHDEGILGNETNMHAGIKGVYLDSGDEAHDRKCGFDMVKCREVDSIGVPGVIERIKARVGTGPVYLSFDIDSVDPAFAPATGTAEPGGWTSREVLAIISGLADLKIVGADLVEVAPMYDTVAEQTGQVAAEILYEILTVMIRSPV